MGTEALTLPQAFEWDAVREQAAIDLADGKLGDMAIAAKAGIERVTLWRWTKHPAFAARVEEHRAAFRAEVRRRGIAVLENRVAAAQDRHERLTSVIDARSADPSVQAVPGGSSGLLTRTLKTVGRGEQARTVEEFAVDTGLLGELRAHEVQVAKELGQWQERTVTEMAVKAYRQLGPDDL